MALDRLLVSLAKSRRDGGDLSDEWGELVDATPAARPQRIALPGRYVNLIPLNAAAHGDALWAGIHGSDELWGYLPEGPFPDKAAFRTSLETKQIGDDAIFFTVIDLVSGAAAGYASYMRMEPADRVMEVGNILYTHQLQRTRGATEAMYLMARHAFEDLGYRRYEWKCNALNEPSRRAALRLGFQFEGIFRQHMIRKGRNRDTAWFSLLDREWPARKRAFERWLDPSNFDADNRQRRSLADCAEVRA